MARVGRSLFHLVHLPVGAWRVHAALAIPSREVRVAVVIVRMDRRKLLVMPDAVPLEHTQRAIVVQVRHVLVRANVLRRRVVIHGDAGDQAEHHWNDRPAGDEADERAEAFCPSFFQRRWAALDGDTLGLLSQFRRRGRRRLIRLRLVLDGATRGGSRSLEDITDVGLAGQRGLFSRRVMHFHDRSFFVVLFFICVTCRCCGCQAATDEFDCQSQVIITFPDC
jgi:hypothetical protein